MDVIELLAICDLYFAIHNDWEFGPCDCEACARYRELLEPQETSQ